MLRFRIYTARENVKNDNWGVEVTNLEIGLQIKIEVRKRKEKIQTLR